MLLFTPKEIHKQTERPIMSELDSVTQFSHHAKNRRERLPNNLSPQEKPANW